MRSSEEGADARLRADLRAKACGKVAVVGIGSILRGDDGLGPKLIELLRERELPLPLFDCGTVPENYIFPILSTSCDTVILVDAADLARAPGEGELLDIDRIANVSFSTHNPSPRLFTDLLKTGKENMTILVLSVQPKTTKLGAPLSEEVLAGLARIADIMADVLGNEG